MRCRRADCIYCGPYQHALVERAILEMPLVSEALAMLDEDVVPAPAANEDVPQEAWACIRNESRPLAERVQVVLNSPSPPHVQRVLLAALGVADEMQSSGPAASAATP